jgi:hypothetical protein
MLNVGPMQGNCPTFLRTMNMKQNHVQTQPSGQLFGIRENHLR